MKIEDLEYYNKYEYIEECKCGKILKVFTQKDDFPEYHTDIYILCDCDELVAFSLPVN